MHSQSSLMRMFSSIGAHSIAWSLRRLHCPVKPSDLVLEVGSGGNPYFRANVLLDAYAETRERHWVPLVHDRPTVLGFVERLPFRDKAFDFVIASHVLEHSTDPARFLGELQRVAKAGYIEVPDALMERLNPYRDHRLEITVRDGHLLIRKKPRWCADPELVELYEARAKKILTGETMRRHPATFHVRYYWDDSITYEVLNPEVDATWTPPDSDRPEAASRSLRQQLSGAALAMARSLLSQRRRNSAIDLMELLACPACGASKLTMADNRISCPDCSKIFPVRNGIPMMFSESLAEISDSQLKK